jgi:hypothetical protein
MLTCPSPSLDPDSCDKAVATAALSPADIAAPIRSNAAVRPAQPEE